MQISTKGRYGLRALLELARNADEKPLSTKEISHRQNITVPYLEQLFFRLKHKGLIKSVRGAQGGYFLARRPSEISVGDIIECLDGPIEFTDCRIDQDGHSSCVGSENCISAEFWNELNELIRRKIHGTSLAELLEKFERKSSPAGESV